MAETPQRWIVYWHCMEDSAEIVSLRSLWGPTPAVYRLQLDAIANWFRIGMGRIHSEFDLEQFIWFASSIDRYAEWFRGHCTPFVASRSEIIDNKSSFDSLKSFGRVQRGTKILLRKTDSLCAIEVAERNRSSATISRLQQFLLFFFVRFIFINS